MLNLIYPLAVAGGFPAFKRMSSRAVHQCLRFHVRKRRHIKIDLTIGSSGRSMYCTDICSESLVSRTYVLWKENLKESFSIEVQ